MSASKARIVALDKLALVPVMVCRQIGHRWRFVWCPPMRKTPDPEPLWRALSVLTEHPPVAVHAPVAALRVCGLRKGPLTATRKRFDSRLLELYAEIRPDPERQMERTTSLHRLSSVLTEAADVSRRMMRRLVGGE